MFISSYHGGLSSGPPAIKGSGPWNVYGSLDHKWQMQSFQRRNKAREVGLFSPQALNRTEKILVICPRPWLMDSGHRLAHVLYLLHSWKMTL